MFRVGILCSEPGSASRIASKDVWLPFVPYPGLTLYLPSRDGAVEVLIENGVSWDITDPAFSISVEYKDNPKWDTVFNEEDGWEIINP